MALDTIFNELFLDPDFWYILGISLIILDILLGLNFFALGFGLGGALTGALIDLSLFSDWLVFWERAAFVFSVASLITLFCLKKFVPQGEGRKDINDY